MDNTHKGYIQSQTNKTKQNKTKKKSPSNCTYSNKCWFQISASINNFDFSKHFSQTKILLKKNRKNEHHH